MTASTCVRSFGAAVAAFCPALAQLEAWCDVDVQATCAPSAMIAPPSDDAVIDTFLNSPGRDDAALDQFLASPSSPPPPARAASFPSPPARADDLALEAICGRRCLQRNSSHG